MVVLNVLHLYGARGPSGNLQSDNLWGKVDQSRDRRPRGSLKRQPLGDERNICAQWKCWIEDLRFPHGQIASRQFGALARGCRHFRLCQRAVDLLICIFGELHILFRGR